MQEVISHNTNSRVSYYFDDEIGMYTFIKGHPMRPLRMKITDTLLRVYGLDKEMMCFDSSFYTIPDSVLTEFHSEEYIGKC
jgi:histone deacetylase 1/2